MTTRRNADQPVSAAAGSLDEAVHDGAGVVNAAPTAGAPWDPYEVWLTRVKQPRERSARKAPSLAGRSAPAEIGGATRTTLSGALSR
jgi:hypothetical protein